MGNWRANLRQVEPYVPGEQPKNRNIIKLNTNENPFPPSPAVTAAIRGVEEGRLRLYPDPDSTALTRALAAFHGVDPSQIFIGVGSDDVLGMAFMTFFNSQKPVLFPDITYTFYEVWANMLRIPYARQPLDEGFRLRAEDYRKENGGIVFPNPNAPTGIAEPLSFVEEIVAGNPDSVVIVDEAYVDFGGETALPLLERYENLLITRTFSKSRSLAGMRIGYAIGNPALIAAMYAVRNSYNSYTMNQTALDAGTASVEDDAWFREHLRIIIETREEAAERLAALGFTAPGGNSSSANFLFVRHKSVPGQLLFDRLRSRNIVVRHFNRPRIGDFLRITIGTREQMEKLYEALEEILREEGAL